MAVKVPTMVIAINSSISEKPRAVVFCISLSTSRHDTRPRLIWVFTSKFTTLVSAKPTTAILSSKNSGSVGILSKRTPVNSTTSSSLDIPSSR